MSNNGNNEKAISNTRFSPEDDISHYTPIVYELNEKEIIKNGGIIYIGSYCSCIDKKKCDCLEKIIQFVNK